MASHSWLKAVSIGLTLFLSVSQVQSQSLDPNDDPFYAVPAGVGSYAKGAVIRSRQVQSLITTNVAASYQFLYRTNNQAGNATATVGTVWVPNKPLSPPRILLYNAAEDAIQLDCNPSWSWVNPNSNADPAEKSLQGPILVPYATGQGFYVVNTDAEGPTSAFIVGLVEGQAALDGVKGASNLLSLDLKTSKVALIGYSGGAHTAVWASTIAASYAPELNITGAAFGGTPIDLTATYNTLDNTSQAQLAAAALFGLGNGYPNLNVTLTNNLNSYLGIPVSQALRRRDYCAASNTTQVTPQNIESLFKQAPLSLPQLQTVLAGESLLMTQNPKPVPVPKFPRLEYHGSNDHTVPYQPEQDYVTEQCKAGANIYFTTFAGADHVPTALAGLLGAFQFVTTALTGKIPTATCGTSWPSFPAPGSSAAVQLLGQDLSNLLCKLCSCC